MAPHPQEQEEDIMNESLRIPSGVISQLLQTARQSIHSSCSSIQNSSELEGSFTNRFTLQSRSDVYTSASSLREDIGMHASYIYIYISHGCILYIYIYIQIINQMNTSGTSHTNSRSDVYTSASCLRESLSTAKGGSRRVYFFNEGVASCSAGSSYLTTSTSLYIFN